MQRNDIPSWYQKTLDVTPTNSKTHFLMLTLKPSFSQSNFFENFHICYDTLEYDSFFDGLSDERLFFFILGIDTARIKKENLKEQATLHFHQLLSSGSPYTKYKEFLTFSFGLVKVRERLRGVHDKKAPEYNSVAGRLASNIFYVPSKANVYEECEELKKYLCTCPDFKKIRDDLQDNWTSLFRDTTGKILMFIERAAENIEPVNARMSVSEIRGNT